MSFYSLYNHNFQIKKSPLQELDFDQFVWMLNAIHNSSENCFLKIIVLSSKIIIPKFRKDMFNKKFSYKNLILIVNFVWQLHICYSGPIPVVPTNDQLLAEKISDIQVYLES